MRRIVDAGGTTRSQSEANLVRMKREGVEGRKRLTKSANEKRRGSRVTPREALNKAAARNQQIGYGEVETIAALSAQKMPTDPQRPCGKYNIDVAVGPVAVELMTSANSYTMSKRRFRKRLKYLTDQGYCVVVVVFRFNRLDALIGNLDDVVAFVKRAYRSPSVRRKHWMIRCRSERFSRVRNDLGQLTAVPMPVRFSNTVSELDAG